MGTIYGTSASRLEIATQVVGAKILSQFHVASKKQGQEKFLKWLNLNLRIILDFTTTDMKGMKHKIKS